MTKTKLTVIIFFIFFAANVFAQYNFNTFLFNANEDIEHHRYVEAIKKLDILIETQPTQPDPYYLRGFCKFWLGDYIGAASDIDNAIKNNPFHYDAFFYRALTREKFNDYNGALSDLNFLVEKLNNRATVELYIERGFVKLVRQNYKDALSDFNKAISMQALNERAYLCRGATYEAMNDYELAISDFSKALKLNPASPNGYVRKGMLKAKMKKYTEAIDDYNEALKIDSGSTLAYYNRAMTELDLKDNEAAMHDYNIVLKFEPRNTLTYYNRGVLKMNTKDIKGALTDFDRVILLNPNNLPATYNRAKLKHDARDYKGALADYDRTIFLWPYYAEAYYNRAILKKDMNNISGANQDFNLSKSIGEMNLLKSDKDKVRDSMTLAQLSKFDGDFDNVDPRATNREANIELMPLFYVAVKDTSQNNRSYYSTFLKEINQDGDGFCFTNKDITVVTQQVDSVIPKKNLLRSAIQKTNKQLFNDAAKDYDRLLSNDSTSALLYFSRGVNICKEMELISLFEDEPSALINKKEPSSKNEKNKRYDKAMDDFTKAISIAPNFALAYYNRAYVKCKLHDFLGAAKDYERGIKADPDFAESYYNKGLLLLYLKEDYSACINLSKAGELGLKEAYAIIKKYCYK